MGTFLKKMNSPRGLKKKLSIAIPNSVHQLHPWPGSEPLLICGPTEDQKDEGKEEQSGETESYPDFILISIDWPPKI